MTSLCPTFRGSDFDMEQIKALIREDEKEGKIKPQFYRDFLHEQLYYLENLMRIEKL